MLVYLPALDNQFTNWDDEIYVTTNPVVLELSPATLGRIWSEFRFLNYQPLTLTSLALDRALWGLTPRAFILHNLLLHLLATALGFALVRRLTASPAAAGLAAALFALHPMHVESVAWVSSRKNVLSTALGLAAVLLFLNWRSRGGGRRLTVAVAAFLAAGLAKATAVTLAPVMAAADLLEGRSLRDRRTLLGLVPFAVLGLLLGLMAVLAVAGGAGDPNHFLAPPQLTLSTRALVAGWAFTTYVVKLLVPVGLSPFYPWPAPLTGGRLALVAAGSAVALALLVAAAAAARRAPVVGFGIAFFTLTIAPLLQLTKVGRAVMADRFVYPPSLGLALVAGWAVVVAVRRWPGARSAVIAGCGVWLVALGAGTAARCNVWQDSETLWSHVLARHPEEASAWYLHAEALFARGDVTGAFTEIEHCLELAPDYGDAAFFRGVIHERRGDWVAAAEDYGRAIALNPRDAEALAARGLVRLRQRQPAAALVDLDRSLELQDEAAARYNRGLARYATGNPSGAAEDFARALELRPGWTNAEINLGATQRRLGQLALARTTLDAAVDHDPASVLALANRALVRLDQGDMEGAMDDARRALSLRPDDGLARLARARALLALGRTDEGCTELERLAADGDSEARETMAASCP